jgi:hypothetical protein
MLNYQENYCAMSDDELLRLASQWQTLTEAAQAALAAEIEKRKLKDKFEATIRIALEKEARTKISSGSPSTSERVMFWLFVGGGISTFLFLEVRPSVFDLTTQGRLGGLYQLIRGISDAFPLWLIIWLVLRAKRIRREIAN